MTVYLDFDSKTLYSEGKTWVDQRRFALRTLRDFGFGKQGMEEMIQDEVEMFKNLISQVQSNAYKNDECHSYDTFRMELNLLISSTN